MFFTNEIEFKKFIEDAVLSAMEKVTKPEPVIRNEKRYLYSIRELAALLNCSVVTAQKFKNNGLIPYKQLGRKIVFDVDAVLSAMQGVKIKGRA